MLQTLAWVCLFICKFMHLGGFWQRLGAGKKVYDNFGPGKGRKSPGVGNVLLKLKRKANLWSAPMGGDRNSGLLLASQGGQRYAYGCWWSPRGASTLIHGVYKLFQARRSSVRRRGLDCHNDNNDYFNPSGELCCIACALPQYPNNGRLWLQRFCCERIFKW